MRRAARKDANHAEIVRQLRQVGARVKDVSSLPGCLDLLVGFRGCLYWLEVKDGSKPPSEQKLTSAEQSVFDEFRDYPVYKVCSVDEALRTIGATE